MTECHKCNVQVNLITITFHHIIKLSFVSLLGILFYELAHGDKFSTYKNDPIIFIIQSVSFCAFPLPSSCEGHLVVNGRDGGGDLCDGG